MDKDEALELLKLSPDATPEDIARRYKQVAAFLDPDADAPPALHELLKQASATMLLAYDSLPKTTKAAKPEDTKGPPPQITKPVGPDIIKVLKHLFFPNAGMDPGPLFSDQWWNVYRRPVLLVLIVAAVGLWNIPQQHSDSLLPESTSAPTGSPTASPTGTSAPTQAPTATPQLAPAPLSPVMPAPDSTSPPGPQRTPTPYRPIIPVPDALLHPNLTPAQPAERPEDFLWRFFVKSAGGKDVSDMMQDPSSHDLLQERDLIARCPAPASMPPDAITIISSNGQQATIRVKEHYLTGVNETSDYELRCTNGSWKVCDRQPVLPANPGDPVPFVYEHIALISRFNHRQAYENLDSDYQQRLSLEDFKRQWGHMWYVPGRSAIGSALAVESETPDAQRPTKATVRLRPKYFTMTKMAAEDGQPADFLIDLVNADGRWLIHDVQRVPASSY